MTDKIRIDPTEMTLGEMAEAIEVAGDPTAAGFNFRQTAALAWIVKRETDPAFSYADALRLKLGELDIVESPPEASGGATGAAPPLSPVSGTLTRSA